MAMTGSGATSGRTKSRVQSSSGWAAWALPIGSGAGSATELIGSETGGASAAGVAACSNLSKRSYSAAVPCSKRCENALSCAVSAAFSRAKPCSLSAWPRPKPIRAPSSDAVSVSSANAPSTNPTSMKIHCMQRVPISAKPEHPVARHPAHTAQQYRSPTGAYPERRMPHASQHNKKLGATLPHKR